MRVEPAHNRTMDRMDAERQVRVWGAPQVMSSAVAPHTSRNRPARAHSTESTHKTKRKTNVKQGHKQSKHSVEVYGEQ